MTSGQDEFKSKMGKLFLLFTSFLQYLLFSKTSTARILTCSPLGSLGLRNVSRSSGPMFLMCFECVSELWAMGAAVTVTGAGAAPTVIIGASFMWNAKLNAIDHNIP